MSTATLDVKVLGFVDRACAVCGWRFFTSAALYEHSLGCRPPKRVAPAQREAGRRVAALNNSRRRRCNDCGYASTPAAVGNHLKHTGHTGWTEAA
ncbi:MAG: hypothetical protein KDB63_14020 [Nocardioidaceae bacterium]|nr:hypothetical protein [Nocardioidaceae bacterium]